MSEYEDCRCDYPWDLPDEQALLEAMRAMGDASDA